MSDKAYELIKLGIAATAFVGFCFAMAWSERAKHEQPQILRKE